MAQIIEKIKNNEEITDEMIETIITMSDNDLDLFTEMLRK